MSRSRFLRSKGRPYFAAFQDTILGMGRAVMPAGGVVEVGLTFRLREMPVQLASIDELHPLVSVADFGRDPAVNLMALGVTPSGKLVAVNAAGDRIESAVAAVAPSRAWHTASAFYDYGATTWISLQLDSRPLASAVVGAQATPILPTYYARCLLFNGAGAETQCACDIATASIGFGAGLDFRTLTWDCETTSDSVACDSDLWPTGAEFDGTLSLGWYDPSPAAGPYGSVPRTDWNEAFAHGIETQFTRQGRAKTAFRRRRVTWLS